MVAAARFAVMAVAIATAGCAVEPATIILAVGAPSALGVSASADVAGNQEKKR